MIRTMKLEVRWVRDKKEPAIDEMARHLRRVADSLEAHRDTAHDLTAGHGNVFPDGAERHHTNISGSFDFKITETTQS